jgi:hypothetical protein
LNENAVLTPQGPDVLVSEWPYFTSSVAVHSMFYPV